MFYITIKNADPNPDSFSKFGHPQNIHIKFIGQFSHFIALILSLYRVERHFYRVQKLSKLFLGVVNEKNKRYMRVLISAV